MKAEIGKFMKNNKKTVVVLLAAILTAVGVPVYLATPLSDTVVEQTTDVLIDEPTQE